MFPEVGCAYSHGQELVFVTTTDEKRRHHRPNNTRTEEEEEREGERLLGATSLFFY